MKSKKDILNEIETLEIKKKNHFKECRENAKIRKDYDAACQILVKHEKLFVQSWKKFIDNTKNNNSLGKEIFIICEKLNDSIVGRDSKKSKHDKIIDPSIYQLKEIDDKLLSLNKKLKNMEKLK